MKILGTLTVDTADALDKVTDFNADLLDGKSSALFLSRNIGDTGTDDRFAQRNDDNTIKDANLNLQLRNGKDFVLFTALSTDTLYANTTNSLTVKSTGRIGITRANPAAKLHVHLTADEKTDALSPFVVSNSADTALFQVDHNGKVSIGKSTIGDSPTNLLGLHIADEVSSGGITIKNTYTPSGGSLTLDVVTLNMNGSGNGVTGSNNASLYTNKKLYVISEGGTLFSNSTGTIFNIDYSGRVGINGVSNAAIQLALAGISTTTGVTRTGVYSNLTYASTALDPITSVKAIHAAVTINTTTTTVNAIYGLYIAAANVTAGTVTSKYGIYQAGASDTNYFNGATTINSGLYVAAGITFAATTHNINIGSSQTSGELTLGGTSQTGTITIGRSTNNQTLDLGCGGTTGTNTKTINIGTSGVGASTTTINIGTSVTSTGTSTINYGSGTGTTHNFSGDVGIGTTLASSYSMKLAVVDNIGLIPTTQNTVGSAVYLKSQLGSSGGESFISNILTAFTNASNYSTSLNFLTRSATGVSERMRITSSGNVLIGTTTDDGVSKLQVAGSAYVNGNVGIGTTNPTGKLNIVSTSSGDGAGNTLILENSSTGGTGFIFKRSGQLVNSEWQIFQSSDSNKFKIGRSGVGDFIIIDASGKVGIGTTEPAEKLDVVGNAKVSGTLSVGGAITATNISNSYLWVFKATTGKVSYVSNVDFTGADNYIQPRSGDVVGASLAASPNVYNKNVCVYRSTTNTGIISAYEQVFPDVTISTAGVCTIAFAADQTNYVFRVIFA